MRNETYGSVRLRALRLLHMEHLLFQQSERNHYYMRRNQAVTNPTMYCSMIMDAMAQYVCRIPRKSKFDYDKATLDQKLIGVLVHGQQ